MENDVAVLSLIGKNNKNTKQRKKIIDNLTKRQANMIKKITSNFLRKTFSIPDLELKKLQKDRKYIYQLANNNVSLQKKKKILKQKGGILPALLPLA